MRVGSFLIALFVATAALASAKGNWYGHLKAEVSNVPGAPIEILSAGIQDSGSQSNLAKAFVGTLEPDTSSGSWKAATVRYDLHILSKARGVSAIEVEWTATNAFDEPLGSKVITFPFKKPLPPAASKYLDETAGRIHDDVAKYRARITRVRFEDGKIWMADATTTEAPSTTAP